MLDNNSPAIIVCLNWLSWMTPVFVVYVFGMVAFLVYRRSYPRRFLLAAMAMSLFLSSKFVWPLMNSWHLPSWLRGNVGIKAWNDLAEGWIGLTLFAMAFELLLFAIFRSGPLWLGPENQVQVPLPPGFRFGLGFVAAAFILRFFVFPQLLKLDYVSFLAFSRIAPSLFLCIHGVIAARFNRRWYRPAGLLVEGAMYLLIFSSVGNALISWSFVTLVEDPTFQGFRELRSWSWVVGLMVCIFSQATAFGMLIRAVFLRAALDLEPSARLPELPLRYAIRVCIAGLSVVLYGIAMVSPFVEGEYGVRWLIEHPGHHPGIFFDFAAAWWANLPFAVAIISLLRGHRVLSGVSGIIALLLGVSYLYGFGEFHQPFVPVRFGYWFWLASMAVMASPLALPKWALRLMQGDIRARAPARRGY